MKAIQYMTASGAEMLQRPVFVSEKLSGIPSLTHGEKIIREDFWGFGVAITGSSCYLLSQMEDGERHAFLESIYGKNGLGLKVGRLSIGASDYSAEVYSYDETEGDTALEHFSIERDLAYVIPVIKEILQIAPDLYLFASPWSPPSWMKTGGSLGGGYMRREFIDCYADYIIRFIREYAKHGIHISAITPQNEPETAQSGRMTACIWHPDIESEFCITLKRKLKAAGLDTGIWLFDHCFSSYERVRWCLETHKGLAEACDGIAFHYYDGSIEQTAFLGEKYPNLPLHFTEGGPRLYDHYDTDWCKWSIMISKALNSGYASFTGWNLMLDELGGPNVGPFFCGGLVTRNSQRGEITYSGQYKAFRHIARFMQAGAKIYEVTDLPSYMPMFGFPNPPRIPIQASCIENPDGSLCYLLVNADKQKAQLQLKVGDRLYYVELLPDTVSTVVFQS